MRYIAISNVTAGMILGRTVYDSFGNALLTAGTTLTSAYLSRLKELGYPALYIRSPHDVGDLDIVEPVRAATRFRAQSTLQKIAADLLIKGVSPGSFDATREVVRDLLDDILSSKQLLINILEIRSFDSYTYGHSVNTCVLSLMAGVLLGLSRSELISLGLGTLLHDLGKLFVPTEILNKPSSLTAEEFARVKEHCERGFNLLRNEVPPLAAHVAYQHHERCDGTGYPRGLKEDAITLFAKITAVADSLDAMTSDRVYSRAMLPERAAAVLLAEAPAKYDTQCVQVVTSFVAPYPIGSLVRLTSGEVGEVVNATRTQTHVVIVRGSRRGQIVVCPDEGAIETCELG